MTFRTITEPIVEISRVNDNVHTIIHNTLLRAPHRIGGGSVVKVMTPAEVGCSQNDDTIESK